MHKSNKFGILILLILIILRSSPPAGGGRAPMFFVYAIYNKKNDKIYIGETNKLEDRLNQHNTKHFSKSFTSNFNGSWELIYKEEHISRQEARKREKQLKSYRGRQFIRSLINNPA